MKEEKRGRITDLIYTNEQNSYAVLLFETDEEQFFAVGTMTMPRIGHEYRLTGEWKAHPKYGEQFAFSSYEMLMPSDETAILSYLASGLIKGIGPATARNIVKKFKSESLEIIKSNPMRLTEVSGIGKTRAQAIAESYRMQTGFADTVVELAKYDISSNTAAKLYKVYGDQTAEMVRTNPYRFIDEVWGIGFAKADKIAEKTGIAKDSEFRIKSGIIYCLEQLANEGNSCYPEKEFVEKCADFLGLTREQIEDRLFDLIVEGDIFREKLNGNDIVILQRFKRAESYCASKLKLLNDAFLLPIRGNMDKLIEMVEKQSRITLSDKQKIAVTSSFQNGVSVITGGPGTGKTTIINTVLAILQDAGIKTLLAAPTGRAAKRMTQAAGEEAMTIHRMLEYGCPEGMDTLIFGKNEENPLDAGCIIVDEASMIDVLLMEALLRAVKPGTRLILAGDADQLPPVGAGNVLSDILSCEYIHSTRLTEIFRQAQESMIVVNAHLINRGEYPSYNEKNTDFFFMSRAGEKDIVATIKELCSSRLPAFYEKIDGFREIQVLTPTRKGPCGTAELNKVLREALNPPSEKKQERSFGERFFREGDKVIQNKNDYEIEWKCLHGMQCGKGLFNGDIGTVQRIDNTEGKIYVLFDGDKLAAYDMGNADEIDPAFALTVHKSQGSEFSVVVMPACRFPPMLATRNLLYTAVTRAKLGVVLVGNRSAVTSMVDNDYSAKRCSGLGERLRLLWENF